jgi:hypothetical protein
MGDELDTNLDTVLHQLRVFPLTHFIMIGTFPDGVVCCVWWRRR